MKKFAYYLPQFHEIPENNKWWGKGFTEWTNVKKAKPLYKNHYQPHIPYNSNYYDLMNDGYIQEEQANLAKKYHVDGFCYYHYWFSGKKLLEKPAERMLKNKKVNIDFCFSWANEHWTRNWDGQNSKIIMEQNYEESESEWKEHFHYLLPFFKDDRYIKKDNRPVFIIYKPFLIKKCSQMLLFWDCLAKENGFSGMYFGVQFPKSFDYDMSMFDFGICFEPLYTTYLIRKRLYNKKSKMEFILRNPHDGIDLMIKKGKHIFLKQPIRRSYDYYMEEIIKRPLEDKMMPGVFPSWDNTPRRNDDGLSYDGTSPNKFKKYLLRYANVIRDKEKDFIFINAWNEWGEGAHLEPDERNGFGYLEAIKDFYDMLDA